MVVLLDRVLNGRLWKACCRCKCRLLDMDASKTRQDPDEKWANQYRERQRNNLYKWVDTSKGGSLIEAFTNEGRDGVLRFAQDKILPMLYHEGKQPELIRKSDYMKWRNFMNTNLNEYCQGDAAEVDFVEHPAAWKLNRRGIEGETLIHLLLNSNDVKSRIIAKILIREYPNLALDIYEGEKMFGQSALHLAIVYDDYECVSLLLEAGAVPTQRASGRFFQPLDARNNQSETYAGLAYYGEFPLAFAASFGNKDIYDLLIQYGADPNAQDSFGNTVLHLCVINNSIDMYSYAVRHWAKPAEFSIMNFAGFTPLSLATKMGRKEIFEEIMELSRVEYWRFSDITCSAYPLATLDTINPDGSTNWDSALMSIINGKSPEQMDMVKCAVVERLLEDKWKAYGFKNMYIRIFFTCLHLVAISCLVYLHKEDNVSEPLAKTITRYIAEVVTLLGCFNYVVYQPICEIRRQGLRIYLRHLRDVYIKTILIFSSMLIFFCLPCRVLDRKNEEDLLLVMAVPGSWIYLLFYARASILTGPFVNMIYSMIMGDMIRFGMLSSVFLLSFSLAFAFFGSDIQFAVENDECVNPPGPNQSSYRSFGESFVSLFRAAMGGYDYEEFDCSGYALILKILFIIYLVIMPIMLINMLIAMMGNTYTRIISQAERGWRHQRAQILLFLERSLSKEQLKKYHMSYSIKIDDDQALGTEKRGLLVIKQFKKTRAQERKHAMANWKHLCQRISRLCRQIGFEQAKALLQENHYLENQKLRRLKSNSSSEGNPLLSARRMTAFEDIYSEVCRTSMRSKSFLKIPFKADAVETCLETATRLDSEARAESTDRTVTPSPAASPTPASVALDVPPIEEQQKTEAPEPNSFASDTPGTFCVRFDMAGSASTSKNVLQQVLWTSLPNVPNISIERPTDDEPQRPPWQPSTDRTQGQRRPNDNDVSKRILSAMPRCV